MALRFALLLVLVLGLAGAPAAQAQTADQALAGIGTELDAARAGFDIPAMAVVVVAEGRVVLATAFGQRGIDDATAVDADTRFAIGSCSKAFTSLGVAMLAEQGWLRFDDLVAGHDPALRLPSAAALAQMRVFDLLSQRSGLARHDFLWHALPGMSRERFAMIQGELPMLRTPGTGYGYTNSAYILAGRLIELKTGMSWEAFTSSRIFEPLGMRRASFSAEGLLADGNAAIATKRRDGVNRSVPYRDGRLLGPAGSINASANDMGRWLLMLTGGGAVDGQALVRPETLTALFTPVGNDGEGYGLGWRVDTWRGQRRISHAGAVDGFRARVTLFPDRGVGIAVMANLGPTPMADFATRVLAERVLGLEAQTDLLGLVAGRRQAEAIALGADAPVPRGRIERLGPRDPSFRPRLRPEAYVGRYTHPAYGDITIGAAADGSGLTIQFGALEGRLAPWRGESFIAFSTYPDDTLDESEITFISSAEGAVEGFSAMIDNDIGPVPFRRAHETALTTPSVAGADLTVSTPTGELSPWQRAGVAFALLFGAGAAWLWRGRRDRV
jgi:CubicO group peptidase (beta-lactamase class C family)